jgi:EAL domain-containing protein (putative c-di-GMP-specific phosphodiesterase class I)
MSRNPTSKQTIWYLEGAVDESGQVFRVPVFRLPFRVGREAGLDLSLPSQVVSSVHAELSIRDRQLVVTDLGSTNGTFVNKIPVGSPAVIEDGDIVQFATLAFRVRLTESGAIDNLLSSTATIDTKLTVQMAENLRKLKTLLEQEAVTQLFQPIVDLENHDILGYEVLGRGNLEGLPDSIHDLFQLAQPIGAEVDLSLVLRRQSVAACGSLSGTHCYFLNTHPAELLDDTLIYSLRDVRANWPDLNIAIEVHESSVTDPAGIRQLQTELVALDMRLVYDDFGSGQARLLELAEVPPAYLKFDRSLIKEIDTAPSARVRLLEGLAKMALELDIRIIAEGLERQEELEICRDLGFSYGQGYLLAVPQPYEEHDGRRVPPPLEKTP